MQPVAVILSHRHPGSFPPWATLSSLFIIRFFSRCHIRCTILFIWSICFIGQVHSQVGMPSQLASGVQHDVVQRMIHGAELIHSSQPSTSDSENDITWPQSLISISWHNGSNLSGGSRWEIVAPLVTILVKAQCNNAVIIFRYIPGDLNSLLEKANSRMFSVQDILENLHQVSVQVLIVAISHAMFQCIIRIIDIQLCKLRGIRCIWNECSRYVMKLPPYLVNPRSISIIDIVNDIESFPNILSNRCHSQSTVVFANMGQELSRVHRTTIVEQVHLLWKIFQHGELNFSR